MSGQEDEQHKPNVKFSPGSECPEDTRATTREQKRGHPGLLSMDRPGEAPGVSTCRDAFKSPQLIGVRMKGKRTELLERLIVQKVRDEMEAELNACPPKRDFCSVTKADYMGQGFESTEPDIMDYDLCADQAITFWSENYQKIQGMTNVKQSQDSPFKRNSIFRNDQPISE